MIPYVCLGIFGENGTLDKYIIFKGDSDIEDKTLFSELEWLSIQDGKQTVITSKQQIFPDDTIHTIKQKILYALQNDARETESELDGVSSSGGAREKIDQPYPMKNYIYFMNRIRKRRRIPCMKWYWIL